MVKIQSTCRLQINSLPNVKIFYVTKLKAFAGDKINIAHTMISVFNKVENIVGKGENADNLSPQRFQEASFLGLLKVLNPYPNNFTGLQCMSFENTVGKGEIAHNQQLLFFPVFSTLFEESKTCHLGKG